MQYNPPVSVLLLGATGFIGSYVLRALLAEGHQVTAIRRKHDSRTPIPMQLGTRGQLQWLELALHNHTKVSDWMPRLEGIDVTINCIGILRQRFGENYNDIHHLMPAALAQACAKREVRLLHTSALGLHEQAKSRL